MGIGAKIADQIRGILQDENFRRAGKGIAKGARGFGPGALRYLAAKVPIVRWLPNYSPRWLIADLVAGQSVGLLLVPQALMFSSLAGIPMIEGLWAAWLPGVIYTIMGTSKDISTGPTSSISLLTGTFVLNITKLAPSLPPSLIAAVISFGVGFWSLAFGLLNLGFIFDFVSLPIVLGFVTGLANIVITAQIPAILGEVGVGPVFIQQMPQIIQKLPQAKPITIGMSLASLMLLGILSFVGKKWGSKNEFIRILSISRNILVLGLMTLISFILNKNLENPLWAITGPSSTTIQSPQFPNTALLQGLIFPSATVFFATALEHVALARFMGHRNGYNVNQSQELVYLGVTNIANSMIGGLPVSGGDLARASVNSESGVKSPLSGIITTSIVLASMFAASDFIKWIPQSTLAAVVIVATFETMPPMANMSKYWKLSFLDFIGFLLSFNFTMINGPEAGIGLAFGLTIITTLLRTMFSWPRTITRSDIEQQYLSEPSNQWANSGRIVIPPGTQIIGLEADIVFLNASRIKRHVLDTVFTNNSGKPASLSKNLARSWDDRRDKHIAALRRKAGLGDVDTYFPRLRILILDFSCVPFVDASGMQALDDIKTGLREYGGEDVDFRFVGLNTSVRKRVERAGWPLADIRDSTLEDGVLGVEVKEVDENEKTADASAEERVKDLVFEILPTAVLHRNQERRSDASNYAFAEELIMQKKI